MKHFDEYATWASFKVNILRPANRSAQQREFIVVRNDILDTGHASSILGQYQYTLWLAVPAV